MATSLLLLLHATCGRLPDSCLGADCTGTVVWRVICPKNCSGHGRCQDGLCTCDSSFRGDACDEAVCPHGCSGHGRCDVSGACRCDIGYTGDDCSAVEPVCPHNCAGHGECNGEFCNCEEGFGGHDCSLVLPNMCPLRCSGHGVCDRGRCRCDPGFDGTGCSRVVLSPGCPHYCSGRGSCAGGSCICQPGYTGAGCEMVEFRQSTCPANCSGHGECVGGACRCHPGWLRRSCTQFLAGAQGYCTANCSGHGVCLGRMCACDAGFSGMDCASVRSDFCPGACSGRGECRMAEVAAGAFAGLRGLLVGLQRTTPSLAWALLPPTAVAAKTSRGGFCVCAGGSSGPSCEENADSGAICPASCSGHGICRDSGCMCEAGFGGDDCGVACAHRCSDHGRCQDDGSCSCEAGWWGRHCDTPSPCPSACSFRGICRQLGEEPHRCFCAPGWTGASDCSVGDRLCPLNCSSHGTCRNGTCECAAGWHGELCAVSDDTSRLALLQHQHAWRLQLAGRPCPSNCSESGVCLHGSCYCNRGHEGPACAMTSPSLPCPSDCDSHGQCVDASCMCDSGWQGVACEVEAEDVIDLPTDVERARLRQVELERRWMGLRK